MCDAILGRRDICVNMNKEYSLPFYAAAGGGSGDKEER